MISKHQFNFLLKMVILTFLFFCVCAFQTSIWPTLFGSFPVPHLWLTLIVFLIIRWPLYTGIFFTYFLGFILIFFTYAPLKMLWITLNLLYIVIWTLKNRINSTSLLSFATLTAISSLLFSLIYVFISSVLEPHPTHLYFFHRITEAGLTFLFSIPLYIIYNFIDNFYSQSDSWNESKPQTQDEYQ